MESKEALKKHRDALTALFSLYAASQEDLYIAYSDKFKRLTQWLLDEEDLVYLRRYAATHADVCGKCGVTFGKTFGGRVRIACRFCGGSYPFSEQLLRLWWPSMLETTFHCSQEFFEGYLADALVLYGEARERSRYKQES